MVKILADVSAGLNFLHSLGFVHRDVKPENLLVRSGQSEMFDISLADFGLVARVGTREGAGTLPFMSRSAHAGLSTIVGEWESVFYLSLVLFTGTLPWMELSRVLPRKRKAFEDLDAFYGSLDSGDVPLFVRQLGEVVERSGVDDVPDFATISAIFSGHGVHEPIDFEALIQVRDS